MNQADNELRFDTGQVAVKHSFFADLLGMCFTLGRTIYLSKGCYGMYLATGKQPDGILFHEYRHFEQQRDVGLVKFLVMYLLCLPALWNPWRRRWELEAYRVSIAFRLGNSLGLSSGYQQYLAEMLSSWRYGWMMRRAEAEQWVREAVQELKGEVSRWK
ncbi:MAG: hypothetical protein HY897_15995 [Deltaproteobacteria bacterium]|nr:hypothetical protein [Deltaproteobacteria bacterium]